jgi:hypothetical protein
MRRNVFRAAAGYIAVAWLLTQVAETVMPAFGWGDQAVRWIVIVALAGFLPVLAVSWAYDVRITAADVLDQHRAIIGFEFVVAATQRFIAGFEFENFRAGRDPLSADTTAPGAV